MTQVEAQAIHKGDTIVEKDDHGSIRRSQVTAVVAPCKGDRHKVHVTVGSKRWCYDRKALVEIA